MHFAQYVCFFGVAVAMLPACLGLLDGIYCGREDCYDVLGVTRQSTKSEIGKAYRLLARKHHPDMHRGAEAKAEAETKFKLVATAYEILRDDESRRDYDYMLDHPEEYYSHYYRYYRRRVAPKVDVRIVIVVTLTIVSIIQYYSGLQRYDSAIKYLATVPKYRNQALEIAKEDIDKISNRKGKNRMSKVEQRDEIERIVRKVIEEKMDVRGGYAKPSIWDVLWVQLLIFPYTLLRFLVWHAKWFWYFTVNKHPYGREEKLYLIRRYMKMGENQFNGLEDHQIEEYLRLELWQKDKFEIWQEEQEEEMKKKLAANPRYKSYRRYMKNHGPGRLTFED
ncbi:dnaJ homolog subfamily C member 25 homolog [Anastrepha obliqua]|uniref:dnaJ homolog subfamily C member 25 homolog n=1 Tax=Anastrepha ludens TaxID=28586 RepID=UPI0023B0CC82|nr:dnaJ homolog subfamily C member 25 homolog [Anastrepha ludens]XP_054727310.1 dnaJ homolog subfamily C member 25 homolog [Anastrepha obliqua]